MDFGKKIAYECAALLLSYTGKGPVGRTSPWTVSVRLPAHDSLSLRIRQNLAGGFQAESRDLAPRRHLAHNSPTLPPFRHAHHRSVVVGHLA